MEGFRDFMRGDLERYLPVMQDYMRRLNCTQAQYGYSPVGECIMRIVNWLRADRANDYEAASFGEYVDTVNLASELWDNWFAMVDNEHWRLTLELA